MSVPQAFIYRNNDNCRRFFNKDRTINKDQIREINQESDALVVTIYFWVKDVLSFYFGMKTVFYLRTLVFPRLNEMNHMSVIF